MSRSVNPDCFPADDKGDRGSPIFLRAAAGIGCDRAIATLQGRTGMPISSVRPVVMALKPKEEIGAASSTIPAPTRRRTRNTSTAKRRNRSSTGRRADFSRSARMEIPQAENRESRYLDPTQDSLTSPACHSRQVNTEMPDLSRPIGLPDATSRQRSISCPATTG